MGFLTSLFGGEPNIWTVGFALIIVLVLIIFGVWLLKVIFNASGNIARGRQKRLGIVDTMAIDSKNNLVLIRRDDVEHLVIVSSAGGTLVEAGIQPSQIPSYETAPGNTENPSPTAPVATIVAPVSAANAETGAIVADTAANAPKAAKQPNGLARFLRRTPKTNTPEPKVATPTPSAAPIELPKAAKIETQSQSTNIPDLKSAVTKLDPATETANQTVSGPALRHTGLLKPVSNMVGASIATENPANSDNDKPSNDDSAMKEAQLVDSKAMESIEEGASSVEDADEGKKPSGKSKPQKKPQKKGN